MLLSTAFSCNSMKHVSFSSKKRKQKESPATRREEIIEMLRVRSMRLIDVANDFLTTPDDIAIDLEHIAKSIYPTEVLRLEVPTCTKCGYAFKWRKKVKSPSRCPSCKGERITDPVFFIESRKKH